MPESPLLVPLFLPIVSGAACLATPALQCALKLAAVQEQIFCIWLLREGIDAVFGQKTCLTTAKAARRAAFVLAIVHSSAYLNQIQE
jgi:hypothetical protein